MIIMVKFAIVGTGAIAGTHIKSILELEGAELVGISSENESRANTAAEKYKTLGYVGFEAMMDQAKPDVICICTASGSHLEPTLAAAKRGIHVLTEKPLEVTLDRADQMIEACKHANVKLGCIFQNRFNPAFQKLKSAIQENRLGRIIATNAYIKWYRDSNYYNSSIWKGTLAGDGGAALINQGIHTIDLLLDVMGDPHAVFGKTRTTLHNIEGEDLGMAIVTFKSGALGTIQGSTAMYPGYPERLEVFGTNGSVILEGGEILHWELKGEESMFPSNAAQGSGASDPMAIGHAGHKLQIQDMMEAVLEQRNPIVDGQTARMSLALVKAIYQSSKLGQEVILS